MGRLLTVIGGPNGSGKTTWASGYLAENSALYLSADAIAAELSPAAPEAARVAAGRRFIVDLGKAMASEQSLVVEPTLSGKRLASNLAQARERGYAISIVYLLLNSAETCWRAFANGHAGVDTTYRSQTSGGDFAAAL